MSKKLGLLIEKANHELELNKFKSAEITLLEAIEIDPKHPEVNYLLGEAYCKQGKFQKSIGILEKANKIMGSPTQLAQVVNSLASIHKEIQTFQDGKI